MSQPLTPPDTQDAQALVLTPPEPVKVVEPSSADEMITLSEEQVGALDARVQAFVSDIVTLDVNGEEFKQRLDAVHALGSKEIHEAASSSNRMLDRPTRSLNDGLFGSGTSVGDTLIDLRQTIEDLDPSRAGDLFTPKKIFGFIPFGNKLRDYFAKYQSSQTHINRIIESLYRGQDELHKDNAAIEQEKANLWQTMQKLKQYVYVGKQIDQALEAKISQIESSSKEKARVIREELLFYTRQKVMDLLTQEAVSVQGYLALDMIRKNNLELIKGVDRATTTTVSALRTAVIVASALNNQKLVLDQISALNKTTSSLIEGTSAMLKQQSVKIHESAASSTLELDKLKSAFQNIYDTMDRVADFKTKALGSMQQTVDTLSTEIEKSRSYVDRVRENEVKTLEPANNSLAL